MPYSITIFYFNFHRLQVICCVNQAVRRVQTPRVKKSMGQGLSGALLVGMLLMLFVAFSTSVSWFVHYYYLFALFVHHRTLASIYMPCP